MHVVFGTGTIGRATIDSLVSRDAAVRAINRSGDADLADAVEVVRCDVSDENATLEAAAGATAIYNCLNPPYNEWAEKFPPLQNNLLTAAERTGARLVSFENLYMYGDPDGKPITEDMPHAAHTRKGTLRAAMADELATAAAAGRVEIATARASDYFGPGATVQSQLGERVIGNALNGKPARVIGDPNTLHSYTYSRDAGRVLATLGTDERAVDQVWIVPNAPARTTEQIIAMIGAEIGSDIKVSAAPDLLLKVMGWFNPILAELPEMLYEWKKPWIVDGARFTSVFGVEATPLERSIPETVAWWQSRLNTG
jgi:nucleoside-diphosphate-sugar epimerase